MWGNIAGVMGKALEKVQMIQSELENQMDAAVGAAPEGTGAEVRTGTSAISGTEDPVVSTASAESTPAPLLAKEQPTANEVTATLAPLVTPSATEGSVVAKKKVTKAGKKVKSIISTDGDTTPVQTQSAAQSPAACDVSPSPVGVSSTEHERALAALQLKHSQELEASKSLQQVTVSSLEATIRGLQEHASEFNKQTFETAQRNWQAGNDAALADAVRGSAAEKSDLLKRLEDSDAAWEEKIASLQGNHDAKISALQADHVSKMRALEASHDSTISALHGDFENKVRALQADFDSKVSALQAQLAASTAEDGDQVSLLTSEFQKQIEALQAKLAQKDEELALKAGELKATRSAGQEQAAELDAQMNALQERIARAEKNLSAVTAERDALLSKADGESPAMGELRRQLSDLMATLAAAQQEAKTAQATLSQRETDIAAVLGDLTKVKEALAERERALETATRALSDQHKLNEAHVQKIADLTAEISEKDARSRQTQSNAAEEEENKKLIARYAEQLKEQGERLASFEREGQSLARKQSEMEKVVRNSKKELRDKDAEIQKLKDSKEQLVKAIEQTQDVLKKHEGDANNASKSLSAMQAVSQASTEKLVRLEAELTAKTEEYASQRRALEAAWTEATELKRTVSELKADRDDLRKRIGEGTSKVMETESSRRDIEQREAVLRATSKQLQDSLQRQMTESATREERLREEVNEMRKRWQEAIASRESMASELGNATAPLLRQISSLQESVRVKSEHWQNVESSLSERALRAENAAEIAEHKRSLMEEQLLEVKQQYASCSGRLSECQAQLSSAETLMERLRKREALWTEEKAELDSKFALEVAQRQSLQATLREIELRHKVEVQELQDASAVVKSQSDLELAMVAKDVELLREELAALKTGGGGGGYGSPGPIKRHQSATKLSHQNLHKIALNGSHDSAGATDSDGAITSSSSYLVGAEQLATSSLPNGETTFAAAEKLQQRSRQREDDLQALALQIQRLEASRNALLEEVSYLSMRNSQLEEQCASVPTLQAEAEALGKRTEMLLVMLGEKEEELEAALGDMREVKHMYRAHLDELLEKANPPLPEAAEPQPSIA